MNNDAILLRRYVEEGSEAAFTELVRCHVDLVYNAALRRMGGDTHRAAEVVQQVFISLARGAQKLSHHAVLAAWLHTATRNAALNLMISEQRRKVRETEAVVSESIATAGEPAPDWDRLRPLLDAAIDELPEVDRSAVILRFLERRPFAEIGAALRVSEDAARMRTDRALDKLRSALARRGITSTAAALGVIVSSQPLISAPAGLVSVLASQSFAAAGAGIFAITLSSFMTTKIITAALLSALVAFGAGTYVGLRHDAAVPPAPPLAEASRQSQLIGSLRQDNQRLSAEIAGLNTALERLKTTNSELAAQRTASSQPAPATRGLSIGLPLYELQRTVMNNLRQIDAARKQYQIDKGRLADSIGDLVGVRRYIKTVRTVGGEDYSSLSMLPGQPLTVTTPDGVSVTFDPAGTMTTKVEVPAAVARMQELGNRVQPSFMKAIDAFHAANNGNNPPSEEAVLPYFATPQEGADYVEFMEARKAAGQ